MSTPTSRSLEDPAADAARLLLRLGLGVLAFGLPVLALLSRRAVFIVFPLAAVLVLLAAMLRGPQASFRHFGAAVTSRLGLAMLFIVGWTALSLTWTPFLAEASDHLLKILGTGLLSVAVVSALPEHTRSSDLNLVPIGVTLGALLALVLAFQVIPAASAEPDTVTLPRGLAGLAVVVWPALGALGARQHWGLAGLLMLGVAAAAALLWSPVVLLALGCGAIALVAARGDLRPVTRGLGLGAALLFVAAPVLPLLADTLFAARGMEASELARSAAAWAAIIKADSARLLTGHGLDASFRAVQAGFLPAATPRSILFEIWYELGIIGALGLAAMLYLAFGAAGRAGAAAGPALAGGLTACLVMMLSGQQTTQIWWITLLAAALVATSLVVRGQYHTTRPLAQIAAAPEISQ